MISPFWDPCTSFISMKHSQNWNAMYQMCILAVTAASYNQETNFIPLRQSFKTAKAIAVSSCKTDFWQVIFCSGTIYDFGRIKITRAAILAKWFPVFLHIKLFQGDISSQHESWWFGQEKWRHAELYDSISWAYRNKRAEGEEHLKFLGSSAGADIPHISLLWKQTSVGKFRDQETGWHIHTKTKV